MPNYSALRHRRYLSERTVWLFRRIYVLKRLKKIHYVALLALSSRSAFKLLHRINPQIFNDFTSANLVSRQNFGMMNNLYNRWDLADYLFGRGRYWESLDIRKDILQTIYQLQGIDDATYYPPLLSSSFTVSIGHIGCILLHESAQASGILVQGKRSVMLGQRIANKDAMRIIGERTNIIPSRWSDTTYFLPTMNIIESLQMWRAKGEFLDRYQIWEAVYGKNGIGIENFAETETKSRYDIQCKARLKELGVGVEDKIALFHLRHNGDFGEVRNVNAESYVKAVRLLQSKGYKIVQIGANRNNSLSRYIGDVIQLADKKNDSLVDLDFYLLYTCALFVGSTSGPSIFPQIFGKPTLITNLTSISRNALSSDTTLYIPKFIHSEKGKMPVEKLLSCRFSFGGEFRKNQFEREGLWVEDNTSDQIVMGVEELIFRTSRGLIARTPLDNQILNYQRHAGAVALGLLVNSVISENDLTS